MDTFNQQIIYVASKNALFKSEDKGKSFKKIFVSTDAEISHIFFDPSIVNILYIATSRNFFMFKDRAKKLFSSPEEEVILTAVKHKEEIYLGTTGGLYTASKDIFNWQKLKGLDNAAVYYIEPKGEKLYLATDRGVYIIKNRDNVERVFVIRKDEESEEESESLIAKVIKGDIFENKRMWLGTDKGLFVSLDEAKTWKKVYIEGIDNLPINYINQTNSDKNVLYIASSKGFFKIKIPAMTSEQIFEGIYALEINWVEFGSQEEIYVATSKGIFTNFLLSPHQDFEGEGLQDFLDDSKIESNLTSEPSIEEIQKAALEYNEVHPDKIKKWRNGLKTRAFFPEVSLDYDKTVTTALGASYDRVQVGPPDWGINFKWDVADLVWNTYENDVDTRSRLNTQLRLDILDEINRVYFERLRLSREITTQTLSEEDNFQKDLRLKELTAILDGYTGGYFSRRLKELNETR